MRHGLRRKTIRYAVGIKDRARDIIAKYEDYMESHPGPSVEQAVLVRLRHNYDDLCRVLGHFGGKRAKAVPCSILELEERTSKMVGELYDMLKYDYDRMQPGPSLFGRKNERIIRYCRLGGEIVNAVEQLDQTLMWHIASETKRA